MILSDFKKPHRKHRFELFFGFLLLCLTLQCWPAFAAARTRGPQDRSRQAETPPTEAPKNITTFSGLAAPFLLDAKAAILIDAKTGTLLYAFNGHERMQPASLSKLVTFYLTLEALELGRAKLSAQVTVSERAWRLSMNSSLSRMFLRVGQSVSIQDLLYGLMVSSGNDAAVALAEHLSGGTDAFTEMMNKRAKDLGLTESHFANPDGLPAPGQYTTANDMAILSRAILDRFPDALTYTGAKEFTFQEISQPNFNTLLFYDRRVDGLKTGHVREAGYHLVATAVEGDMRLISVVLGSRNGEKRRVESQKLLSWGFRTFATVRLDLGKEVPEIFPVYGGEADQVAIAPLAAPCLTVLKGHEKRIGLAAEFPSEYLVAPVAKDAIVGKLTVTADGNQLTSVPIRTQAAVGQGSFFKRIMDRIRLAWRELHERTAERISRWN